MTVPAYKFLGADVSTGLTATTEGATDFYHPLLPFCLVSAAGFLLLLNGWNLNKSMSDTVGQDGLAASALKLLQMRAPREPITPLLSQMGTGRVFRRGAKWRYRWRDSRTGEHSGLSPLPDALDVGQESPPGGGTVIGQIAWFNIPTSGKPSSADTADLFANTAEEDETWYLADSQPTGAASYVLLTDNHEDDELFTSLAVVTGTPSAIPAGPTWSEGVMDPRVKAWLHPSGRVFYFGLRRFGKMQTFDKECTLVQGSDVVSCGTTGYACCIEPGRIGQRVRFFTDGVALATPINDPTVYRIVRLDSSTGFRVWPEIQASSDLALGATAKFYMSIEDDRDARLTYMSEPNKPWLIDPLKAIAAGDDFDDGVLHWFVTPGTGDLNTSIGTGRVFMQTRRRIYAVGNSVLTDDPSQSALFTVVSDEGTSGFWSGCETPVGWVFYHPERGMRLFDGVRCRPLDSVTDEFDDFNPVTQFQSFEPSMSTEVRVAYDGEHRTVLVSYVPLGGSSLREIMVFSFATKTWRGPYRECASAFGWIRTTQSSNVFVQGDEYGELMVRDAQSLDVTPALSGYAGTGTVSTVQTSRVFTSSGAAFNGDGDERLRGSPVWFYDGTYYYFARVADVLSATQIELNGPPVREDGTISALTAGWTFSIGSIRWSVVTAYIDGSSVDDAADPARPFEAFTLNARIRRGTAQDSWEASASPNASGTYVGPLGGAASTHNPSGRVHAQLRLQSEGALTQLRLRGTARGGDPQIAKAVLVAEEREGELTP